MQSRRLVVSYDVVDDRRRARLARYLVGQMRRVQKSVFEGPLPESRLEPMRAALGEAIDKEEDSVRLYTLCERCRRATEVIGVGVYVERADEDLVV